MRSLFNSPVQGSEADGAKQAMSLLWERRDQCPGAVPVMFVHDETSGSAAVRQKDRGSTRYPGHFGSLPTPAACRTFRT